MGQIGRSIRAAGNASKASTWKTNLAMVRTSFITPAACVLAATLLIAGCKKEEDPATPDPVVDNSYPAAMARTGTYTGTYYFSSTFNWAGTYSHFDTTFQAVVQVSGEESRPEERRLFFGNIPAGYRPDQGEPVLIWSEIAQRYQGSVSMGFHGPDQDSVNFTAEHPGTTTQRTFRFDGVRQH